MHHGDMGGDHMAHMHGEKMDKTQPAPMGPCDPKDPNADDRPPTCGVHNQMMVGQQTIYLSHLPMFMFDPRHHEHNFQVILEVVFTNPSKAQAAYVDDRKKHPHERMYTMSPDAFEMIELDPQHPRRQSLTGRIFRGHLERGGRPIVDRATAQIVNTVYFHEFERKAQPLAQLEYLLFGRGHDLFLAHRITRPPDFDQILTVTVSGHSLMPDSLNRGIRISVAGRANTPHARIKPGETFTAQAKLGADEIVQPAELQLEAGIEFYFEEGELGDPDRQDGPGALTFDPTPEEKAAGF
jgi:hypothetical protein